MWALVIARHVSITVQLLGVLIAGSVIGHAFFNHSIGPIPVTIDRVLLVFVAAQLVIQFFWKREKPFQINRLDILVAGLFLLLTISTFTHDWQYKEKMPLGRLLFFNWIPIAIYFLTRSCELKKIDLQLIFVGLTLFGLYLSATAFAEVMGPASLVFPRYIASPDITEFLGRARGPFLNPVSCGIYQIICMAGAMMFWPHLGRAGKLVLILLAPIFLGGIFLTLTRSIWLTAAWVMFLIVWLPQNLKYKCVLAMATAASAFLGMFILSDQLDGFKRDKYVTAYEMSQSAKLRPMLAVIAYRMFQERPVFGCGFGQYTYYKKPHHFVDADGKPLREVLGYMQHNVFLNYLVELGIVGLTLLIGILASIVFSAWRVWRNQKSSLWARQVGLMTLTVVSAYVINGVFHDVSIIDMIGSLLFFFAGVNARLLQQSTTRTPLPEKTSATSDPEGLEDNLWSQAA